MLLGFQHHWDLFHKHVVPWLDIIDMINLERTCRLFAIGVRKEVRKLKKTYSQIHQVFFRRYLVMKSYILEIKYGQVRMFKACFPGFHIKYQLILMTDIMIFDCWITHPKSSAKKLVALVNGEVWGVKKYVGNDRLSPKWSIPVPKQKSRISNYIPLLRNRTTTELLNIYFNKFS